MIDTPAMCSFARKTLILVMDTLSTTEILAIRKMYGVDGSIQRKDIPWVLSMKDVFEMLDVMYNRLVEKETSK